MCTRSSSIKLRYITSDIWQDVRLTESDIPIFQTCLEDWIKFDDRKRIELLTSYFSSSEAIIRQLFRINADEKYKVLIDFLKLVKRRMVNRNLYDESFKTAYDDQWKRILALIQINNLQLISAYFFVTHKFDTVHYKQDLVALIDDLEKSMCIVSSRQSVELAGLLNYPPTWINEDGYVFSQGHDAYLENLRKECTEHLTIGKQSCEDPKVDQPYQNLIKFLFRPFSPVKKLAILHRTGSGKSRTIVNILNSYYYYPQKILVLVANDMNRKELYVNMMSIRGNLCNYLNITRDITIEKMQSEPEHIYIEDIKYRKFDMINVALALNCDPIPIELNVDWTSYADKEYTAQTTHLADAPLGPILVLTYDEMQTVLQDEKMNGRSCLLGIENFADSEKGFKFSLDNSVLILDEAHYVLKPRYELIHNLIMTYNKDIAIALLTATPDEFSSQQVNLPDPLLGPYADLLGLKDIREGLSVYNGNPGILLARQFLRRAPCKSEYFTKYRGDSSVFMSSTSEWSQNVLSNEPNEPFYNEVSIHFPKEAMSSFWDEATDPDKKEDEIIPVIDAAINNIEQYYPKGFELICRINSIRHNLRYLPKMVIMVSFGSGIRYLLKYLKQHKYQFLLLLPNSEYSGRKEFKDYRTQMDQEGKDDTNASLIDRFNNQDMDDKGGYRWPLLIMECSQPEGVNILGANYLFILEVFSSPLYYLQAIGRINRTCDDKRSKTARDAGLEIVLFYMESERDKFERVYELLMRKVEYDDKLYKQSLDYNIFGLNYEILTHFS